MTDKDTRVRIQIRNGGAPINFSVITGKVLDVGQLAQSETHVSGGGGGGGNNFSGYMTVNSTSPISSRTENWTTDTIFLKYDAGEISFKIRNNPLPVRAGNRLAVVYASWPSKKSESLLALYNYDTDKGQFVGKLPPPPGVIAPALIWGIPGLVFASIAISLHDSFFVTTLTIILSTALVSIIPWIVYRVWVNRRSKKRLQAIFGNIVKCLAQGRDLETLQAG